MTPFTFNFTQEYTNHVLKNSKSKVLLSPKVLNGQTNFHCRPYSDTCPNGAAEYLYIGKN